MRLRFSLRTLLIGVTLTALCLWWFTVPTLTAQRYVRALEQGDFETANGLCHGSNRFPGGLMSNSEVRTELNVTLFPITWEDAFSRTRRISVGITTSYDDGMVSSGVGCTAKGGEIHVGLMTP